MGFVPSANHMHLMHVAFTCVGSCPQCEKLFLLFSCATGPDENELGCNGSQKARKMTTQSKPPGGLKYNPLCVGLRTSNR